MTLGWSTSNSALLAARAGHAAFCFNKKLYVLGGTLDFTNPSRFIEVAQVNADGSLSAFVKSQGGLPVAMNGGRVSFGFAQAGNKIYMVGGTDATAASTVYGDVAVGTVSDDGIVWATGPSLPLALGSCECAIVGSWLYCVGGVSSVVAPAALITATSGGPTLAVGTVVGNAVVFTLVSQTFTSSVAAGRVIVIPTTSGVTTTATVQASLVNQSVTYTATAANVGTAGNTISLTIVNPGSGTVPLSAAVVGKAITITLQYGGGVVITTPTLLVAAITAGAGTFAPVKALVTAAGASSSAMVALSLTDLASGVDSTASNAGVYVVTGTSSTTVIHATKVRDIAASTLTPPIAVTAQALVHTSDVELSSDLLQSNPIQASKIQSDGSLGPWFNAGTYPGASASFNLVGHTVFGGKSKLYIAGGQPLGVGGTQLMYAGTPDKGSGQNIRWSTQAVGSVKARVYGSSLAAGGLKQIVAGGSSDGTDANGQLTVEELTFAGDGSLVASSAESSMPAAVTYGAAAVCGKYLYSIGGINTSSTNIATIYVAALQSDLSF